MNDTQKARQPKGIPVGGQFAASAKGESGIGLSDAAGAAVSVRPEAFAAALERYDLAPDLVGPDGLTLAQAWDERFAVLAGEEVEATEHVIRDAMGNPNYGRERGGPYLVWFDPNNSARTSEDYWNEDEPTGQWESVTPENIDDPRGRVLAAEVYTRNGGGNRECWGDEDECGPDHCTAGIVDALQARPDYIHDADEDGDRTYASFYFRLPDDPRLAQSVRNQQTSAAQHRARFLLADIESGKVGPWDVFGPNATTDAMLAEATERTRAPYPARPNERGLHWLPNSPTDEDAEYLDAFIRAARNGEDAPDDEGKHWRRTMSSSPITWGKKEHAAHETVADLKQVDLDFRAGRVPESAMRLIGGHASLEDRIVKAERDLMDAQTRLLRDLDPLERGRDWARAFRGVTAAREAAKAEVADLTWAHRWPGTPDTVPARPAPDPDPFEDLS